MKRAETRVIQVVSVPEARRASLISSRNVLANLQFPGDTVDPNVRGRPRPVGPHRVLPPPERARVPHTHPRVRHPRARPAAQIALLESMQPSDADLRRRNSRDAIVPDPLMFGIPSA